MQLQAIYTGKVREVQHQGKTMTTAIYKTLHQGPAQVTTTHIEGDEQANLKVHGGINKAVYAYPAQHYQHWQQARPDLNLAPGAFGENLAVTGLDEHQVCVGDTYRIGTTVLEVTTPRMPCHKLGAKVGDATFIKTFLQARLSGFYFKVLQTGTLQAGDAITKLGTDGHGLSIDEVVRLYHEDNRNIQLLQKAIDSPTLQADWKATFTSSLHKATTTQ